MISNRHVLQCVLWGRRVECPKSALLPDLNLELLAEYVNHPNPRPLTYEDAQAIASQVPAIAAISPELSGKRILSFGNRTSNSPLIGVGAQYLNVRNRQLSKGRFIMESDLKRDNRVIVLGSELAKNLFGNRNPVGENPDRRRLCPPFLD